MRSLAWFVLSVAAAPSLAQTVGASSGKPVFVPGLYATETRNAAIRSEEVPRRTCLAAADFDAFRQETIAHYLEEPQFRTVCILSDSKPIADGFAVAMDCGNAKVITAYHFAKNLVSSTTQTSIAARPDYSSTIVTLWRRIGDCLQGTPL